MYELPDVRRFNPWRQWRPIVANCSQEEYHCVARIADQLPNAAAKAAYRYCHYTGCTGVEFVILSSHVDPAPFRTHQHGITIVPCDDVVRVAGPSGGFDTPARFLYDAWLPLTTSERSEILDGLKRIEETVDLIGHLFHSTVAWIPKYVETVSGSGMHRRDIVNDDNIALGQAIQRLAELPQEVQAIVARAIHWSGRAALEFCETDRFLHMWMAFESLLLGLYEHAGSIGLLLPGDDKPLTKKERHVRVADRVREILDRALKADPVGAVQTAYFDAIVPIRRRVEAVLTALLGPHDPRVMWPYGAERATNPSKIRTDLVHRGRSASEIEASYDLQKITASLYAFITEVIQRVLERTWGGAHVTVRPVTASLIIGPQNAIACSPGGGWSAEGDFNITPQLLWNKGLMK